MKRLSKKANKSNKFKYAIENQQKKRNLKQLHLQQEVATRFTATWTMARSFLNQTKWGEEVVDERAQANFNAINAAMVEVGFKKKDQEDLKLKEEDLIKLKELVKVINYSSILKIHCPCHSYVLIFLKSNLCQFLAAGRLRRRNHSDWR